MGFGRQAEVLGPEHVRQAVAKELVVAADQYGDLSEEIAAG